MTQNNYLTALKETTTLCHKALEELFRADLEMQEVRKKFNPELMPLYADGEKPFEEDCRKAVARFEAAEKAFNDATAKKEELKVFLEC